ncbi:hypothetical protein GWI33_009344 [Rhynchophorus ferrugineus]|uniref:Uncharacterized protein n=1 Tax=Rhynchophorus ferrugineus TaxID=354439 RepID=A0A834MD15_RHYFE|nr:hypothetical protein GWI33_009344 [Rhynchophorus ferrugineus]
MYIRLESEKILAVNIHQTTSFSLLAIRAQQNDNSDRYYFKFMHSTVETRFKARRGPHRGARLSRPGLAERHVGLYGRIAKKTKQPTAA